MYIKFAQSTLTDKVKDMILSGDFNCYYGEDGSILDDDLVPDFIDDDDDDVTDDDVDYDFIDIDEYSNYSKLYGRYYLAESDKKKYNIVDSSRVATILDVDAPYIRAIGKSGLVIIGNEHAHDAIDFKNIKPNYLFDLDELEYPMGYDWFVVNRPSIDTLLLSDGESFQLFNIRSRRPVNDGHYNTVQRVKDDVFLSSSNINDTEIYEVVNASDGSVINLSDMCNINTLNSVEVVSNAKFHAKDANGNMYEIELDEAKNYKINKI